MGAWEDGFGSGYARGYADALRGTSPRGRQPALAASIKARKPAKRKGKKNPRLSRAMKKAYKKAHLKNGKFRKGWDRSRMLKYAHKIK